SSLRGLGRGVRDADVAAPPATRRARGSWRPTDPNRFQGERALREGGSIGGTRGMRGASAPAAMKKSARPHRAHASESAPLSCVELHLPLPHPPPHLSCCTHNRPLACNAALLELWSTGVRQCVGQSRCLSRLIRLP